MRRLRLQHRPARIEDIAVIAKQMADLELKREVFSPSYTSGSLYLDGVFQCFTLEDAVREGAKVAGATAIPAGRYRLEITYSPRFKQDMPILWDVPGFTGVRIHTGNTAKDTEGCILVGEGRGEGCLTGSRRAYNAILGRLKAKISLEPVFIKIC